MKLAELKVASYFLAQGKDVFLPIGNTPVDMLVVDGGSISRVQVKSTRCMDRGKWVAQLKRVRNGKCKKYEQSSCDILAIYIVPEDRIVELPSPPNTSAIAVR